MTGYTYGRALDFGTVPSLKIEARVLGKWNFLIPLITQSMRISFLLHRLDLNKTTSATRKFSGCACCFLCYNVEKYVDINVLEVLL